MEEKQTLSEFKNETVEKLKCPCCGGRNLQMVTETNTTVSSTGGGYSGSKGCLGFLLFGPFGLLCGNCGKSARTITTTTSNRFWVCKDCGEKFKDIKDKLEEAKKKTEAFHDNEKFLAIFSIAATVCGFLSILFDIVVANDSKMQIIGGLGFAAGIISLVAARVYSELAKKAELEWEELEKELRK